MLEQILDDATVSALQDLCESQQQPLSKANEPLVARSAAVVKASAEPVALWLMRQYMETESIRFAHTPGLQLLRKEDGLVQGWHSDFPYHWGIDDLVPTAPEGVPQACLGVQFDIMVHDWTPENGAEVLKIGSHTLNHGPPEDWGLVRDHMQDRSLHLYDGPEAEFVGGAAGSILLYDARCWHHVGANTTDSARGCLMNCVIPAYLLQALNLPSFGLHFYRIRWMRSEQVYAAADGPELRHRGAAGVARCG